MQRQTPSAKALAKVNGAWIFMDLNELDIGGTNARANRRLSAKLVDVLLNNQLGILCGEPVGAIRLTAFASYSESTGAIVRFPLDWFDCESAPACSASRIHWTATAIASVLS